MRLGTETNCRPAKTVVLADRIVGCPHEKGIDCQDEAGEAEHGEDPRAGPEQPEERAASVNTRTVETDSSGIRGSGDESSRRIVPDTEPLPEMPGASRPWRCIDARIRDEIGM
jgi:hypothetical protein